MGSSAEVGLLSVSGDVDFAGETPKASAAVPAGAAPGACVSASAISFFARRTLPWAAVPSVGLKVFNISGRLQTALISTVCLCQCVHRKPKVAATRAELCHGSHKTTYQRECHTVKAPTGCSLASAAVQERKVSVLKGGQISDWLGCFAGSAHQLLLGQALDVQLGALADLAGLDARLLLPPRIHL